MSLKQAIGRAVLPRLPITRFLFDQLRVEMAAAAVKIANRALPRWRHRLELVAAGRDLLVNVACGPDVLDGFLNLDLYATSPQVVRWDCRRALPLRNGSAAGVRVEHFVEHLDAREELPLFLRDCSRALAVGGVLRIVVPDGGRFIRAYCDPTSEGFRRLAVPNPFPSDLPTRMDVVNHVFHQWHEHRWAYDFEALADRLHRAGFSRVQEMSFRHSLLPRLATDRDVHAPYSLYVDAVKEA
jgi:predicted SAM-dependent methyltransferase